MPQSVTNPLARLKALLKTKGLANSQQSVARSLFNLATRGDGGEPLDPTQINRLQFSMLLLRAGLRMADAETQAVFRELAVAGASGDDHVNLVTAMAKAEAPRVDRKLRSAEAILDALKAAVVPSRAKAADLCVGAMHAWNGAVGGW
jgi:hypothetical protein